MESDEHLLLTFPVTHISTVSQVRRGDTVAVTATYTRPDRSLFSRVADMLYRRDTAAIEKTQRAFKEALARARKELQTTDTATFQVLTGPRIARWRTGTLKRDSADRAHAAQKSWLEISQLVRGVGIRNATVSDYSDLFNPVRPAAGGGGAIQGTLDLLGVELDTAISILATLQCQAWRNSDTIQATQMIVPSEFALDASARFTCLWIGNDAGEWRRVRPTHFRVRLTARFGGDSVLGSWFSVSQ